jgi:cephalosporin hydroxylase
MDLQEIGLKYGTDKSRHQHAGITYLTRYQPHLEQMREASINILEIGVLGGKSIKMWRDYFPNANIIGLDIDPTCKKEESERIEIFIGSQDDVNIKNNIQNKYGNLNIVIDDGSHVNQFTFASFELYWPMLASKGIYIIEDTHCVNVDLTQCSKQWPGMSYNKNDIEYDNRKISYDDFLLDKINNFMKYNIFNISIYVGIDIITRI